MNSISFNTFLPLMPFAAAAVLFFLRKNYDERSKSLRVSSVRVSDSPEIWKPKPGKERFSRELHRAARNDVPLLISVIDESDLSPETLPDGGFTALREDGSGVWVMPEPEQGFDSAAYPHQFERVEILGPFHLEKLLDAAFDLGVS